jgi:hypothetical protein
MSRCRHAAEIDTRMPRDVHVDDGKTDREPTTGGKDIVEKAIPGFVVLFDITAEVFLYGERVDEPFESFG